MEQGPKEAFRDLASRLLARTLEDAYWGLISKRFDEAAPKGLSAEEAAAYAKAAKEAPSEPRKGLEARFQALLEKIPLADTAYSGLRASLEEVLLAVLPARERDALELKRKRAEIPKVSETAPEPKPALEDLPLVPPPVPPARSEDGSRATTKMPTGLDPSWNPLTSPPQQPPQNVSSGDHNTTVVAPPPAKERKKKERERKTKKQN